MAMNFGGSRVQPGGNQQSQAPQLKLAGARALAEGIAKAGQAISQAIQQQRELELKKQLASQDLASNNIKLIRELGKKLVPSKDIPGQFDAVDASAEREKMLMTEQAMQARMAMEARKLAEPMTSEKVNNLAAALRGLGITETEEFPLELGGTMTVDPSQQIAKGLVEASPTVTQFLTSAKSQESREGIAAKKESGLSERAVAKTASAEKLANQKMAFQQAQADKKFEREMIMMGYEYDLKEGLIKLGEEAKKRIVEFSAKFKDADAPIAARLIAEMDANPFGMAQVNRERASMGLPAFKSMEEYLEDRMRVIKGAKAGVGGLTKEEEAALEKARTKK